jgi:hypothetical protein
MKEEIAVAIMMGNLKGRKHKPSGLFEFAEACRFLINKWGIKEMSNFFHVSEYMLRQIDKINELKKPKLRKLVKDGKLGIEGAYHLTRIKEPKRTKVADIITDMNTNDRRRFIYFVTKNPNLPLSECKKLFEKEKPEEIKLLVLPLDSGTYEVLLKEANRSHLKIHDYVLKVLRKIVNEK